MHASSHAPSEAVLDTPAQVASTWSPARALQGLGKHIKPVIAGGVLLAAMAAIVTETSSVTSNNAVISAHVVTVRSPLEGTFAVEGPKADSPVERGASLGAVTNPRVNTLGEQIYLSQSREAQSQVAAIDAERMQLLAQRAALLARAAAHTAALSARMSREVAEGERVAAVRRASLELAKDDMNRGRALYNDGILSRAAYEKMTSDAVVAQGESSAQEADLAATRVEEAAVRQGLMIETGSNNDVAYSMQRIDEINLRLADLTRERAAAAANGAAAVADYGPVVARDKLLGRAVVTAPAAGDLWKWYAADGERLGVGDRVAEIVDCRESFLLASFPQDRVPAIAIGARARYRLAGENTEHTARVASIEAEQPAADVAPLAARPVRQSDSPAVLVRLALDPGDRPRVCAVGRTASVAIDARAGNMMSTLFERYF